MRRHTRGQRPPSSSWSGRAGQSGRAGKWWFPTHLPDPPDPPDLKLRHVGEDRRLVEEPFGVRAAGQPVPAAYELRAFLPADLDIRRDGLELSLTDHRPHLRIGTKAIADAQRPRSGDELIQEAVVHLLVDHDAAGGRAALAAGAEPAPQTSLDRKLEVRIVHD